MGDAPRAHPMVTAGRWREATPGSDDGHLTEAPRSGTPLSFLSVPTGANRADLPLFAFGKIITFQRLQMLIFRATPTATGVIREWVEEGGAVIVKERMRLDLKRLRHIEFP